jgi:hypothetical protein
VAPVDSIDKPTPLQVRLPADVYLQLKGKAEESGKSTSMNRLVEIAVRKLLDDDALIPAPSAGASDSREGAVVSALTGDIGALKGIAQHYGNSGLVNLSSLLYGLAAEITSATDPKAASKELVQTAGRLPAQRRELTITLLRVALQHNPQNEVAKNLLGQQLYFAKDFREAVGFLEVVRDRDNRAKLFHGLASLHLARAASNASAATRARGEIVDALEAWAFGNRDARERARWIRQVAQLAQFGADFRQTVDELLAYANDNTSWLEISRADIAPLMTSPTEAAEDV